MHNRNRYGALSVCIALVLATSQHGCAAMWSANVSHNSGGSACASATLPPVIDIALATGGVYLTATAYSEGGSDNEKGIGIATIVIFGLSGIFGTYFAHRCHSRGRGPRPDEWVPLSSPQPIRYREPGAQQAAPAPESNESVGPTEPSTRAKPLGESEESIDEERPQEIPCHVYNKTACPAMHICVATDGFRGVCRPMTPKDEGQP